MLASNKFFHSKLLLLLMVANFFLLILGIILIVFSLDSRSASNYIVEYRANYGIGEYSRGFTSDIVAFIVFMIANVCVSLLVSIRVHALKKSFSVVILSVCLLANLLAVIVSNSLMTLG